MKKMSKVREATVSEMEQLPALVQDTIEYYQMHYSDYVDVDVIIDEDIPHYHGDRFLTAAIRLRDTRAAKDAEWVVFLDEDGDAYFNPFEDVVDELNYVADMWKYMYFDVASRLRV